MSWFLRIADLNLQALGFSQEAQAYLMSLNNWDRGTAVELSKLTNAKDVTRLEFHLNRYKGFLHEVQGKIPNRFLFPVYAWLNRGTIRLPEDLGRLTRALSVFTQQNNKFELKNIQQYPSLGDLEEAVSKVTGVNEESKRQVAKNIKMQGSREIYRDNEWRVIEMTTPEAVCELGKGTKWCTNADNDGLENAQMYLESGPLFLFLHNEGGKWQKYAQATKGLDQVMDILDKSINKPPQSFIEVLKKLVQLGHIKDEDFFSNYAKDVFYEGADEDFVNYFKKEMEENDGQFPSYLFNDILEYARDFGRLKAIEEKIIFKPIMSDKKMLKNYGVINGSRIEEYMETVLSRGLRWPEERHEAQIINSTYAHNYWKDRYSDYSFGEGKPGNGDYSTWPEYEAAMFENPRRAEEVVSYLWHLNGNRRAEKRFEDYLLKVGKESYDFEYAIEYAKNCNFRWSELENSIIQSKKLWDIYQYSKEVIRGRWPEAESLLLNDKWGGLSDALFYVKEVVKQRWPELEQKIMEHKNGWAAGQYAVIIMKSRWPEMEPYILNDKDKAVPIYYEKNFGIAAKNASNTNWYKKSQGEQVYNLDDNYLSIGHSGFDKGEYGCNYIWVLYRNGSFLHTKETDLVNNHGTWKVEGELSDDYIYKGRVDTCKKVASLVACDACFDSALRPMNATKEMYCKRMKEVCENNIHRVFGNDIVIREFL